MSSMGSAAEARAILYPYQRRWIDDQSRFKIGMFSRQTGKTYTSIALAVRALEQRNTQNHLEPSRCGSR